MISSRRACRALSRGRDFDGLGYQSSVLEVWRTSKFSPGIEPVLILRNMDEEIREGVTYAVRMNELVSIDMFESTSGSRWLCLYVYRD